MRYFVTFLIGLGLVILVIIFLIRLIFGGNSTPQTPQAKLLDYSSTNVTMRLIIDGPVVADQDHRQIQIDIGENSNEIDLITGYQGNVSSTKTANSNSSAYANFLRAIDLQGYTKGDNSKALADYRGYCPQGSRFVYQIIDGSQIKQSYWSTSCGGTKTFGGQSVIITNLFKAQIPDYNTFTSNFGLQ